MKYLIPILLIITSCGPSSEEIKDMSINKTTYNEMLNTRIVITTIDSCEYVILEVGITHKGNCKYCKTRK